MNDKLTVSLGAFRTYCSLHKCEACIFDGNCTQILVDDPYKFSEMLSIAMNVEDIEEGE